MEFPIRINKYLREQRYAARREADRLIEQGLVTVNGQKATVGMMIKEGDRVVVEDRQKRAYRYLAYYKPRGLATQGPPGSATSVVTIWAKQGLFPVGRLDRESEGLLLLTNDGRVTTHVLGAESGFEKEYLVSVKEPLKSGLPAIFKKGMVTEALGQLLPAEAKIISDHTVTIILHEGKRHQIRVMLSDLGYTVTQLKRVRVGHIRLGNLLPRQTHTLTAADVLKLVGGDGKSR